MSLVLVIDDDAGIRDLLAAYLSIGGHDCLLAANGFDGLKLLRETSVEVVITDLVMRYDGMMTIRVLKEEFPSLPVIAMSGYSRNRLERARVVGADQVLHKPFTPEEFRSVFATALPKAG